MMNEGVPNKSIIRLLGAPFNVKDYCILKFG